MPIDTKAASDNADADESKKADTRKRTSVRMELEDWKQLKKIAFESGGTLQDVFDEMIREYLARHRDDE